MDQNAREINIRISFLPYIYKLTYIYSNVDKLSITKSFVHNTTANQEKRINSISRNSTKMSDIRSKSYYRILLLKTKL